MADQHKNFAYSTVATAPSPASSGTSVVVASGHGARFPATPFNATIWPDGAVPTPANAEIVRVTNISSDTLTIQRAQESTTARSVIVGDQIAATATVKTFTDIETALVSHAVTGNTAGVLATVTSGTLVLAGGNNITLSQNGNSVTVSGQTIPSVAGLLSAINASAGTTSGNVSALTFGDGGGVSFGLNAGVITAAQSVQTQGRVSVQGSTGAISFANANGITFGGNASTLTASHDGLTSQSNQAFSAGGGSSAFQTLVFANSQGVSFSNSNGSVVATVATNYAASDHSHGNPTLNLTNLSGTTASNSAGLTLSLSAAATQPAFSGGISGGNTAGDTGTVSNRVVFAGGNNITVSGSTNAAGMSVTISGANVGGAQTGISGVQVSDATFTSGTVTLRNANGISFGSSGANGISASYTVPSIAGLLSAVNVSAGTTSNNLSALTFANGNGVSFGIDGSTVTASHNGLTSQSNQAFSAQGGSSAFQTLIFANSQGVSFSNSNGSVVATVATNYAASDHSHGNPTLNLTNLSGTTASNSAGLTLSLSAAAAQTGISGIQVSDTTYSSGTVTFRNLNGISFGSSGANGISASYTVPTVTTMTVSDAATSGTLARLAFTNLNGVTLSLSTGAGGSHTIVGSHNALTSQSNQNVTAANGGFAFQTLSFSNLNGISFGTSAGSAITASHNALTSQSNQAFSAAGGSSAFQTLSFNNANGLSFSNNGGAVEASYTSPVVSSAIQAVGSATGSGTNTSRFAADDHVHEGVFSVGVSNLGNSAGDTRVGPGRFVLAGGNNITLSMATAANALNTISVVGGAGGAGLSAGLSNIGNTSGDTGAVTGRLVFAGGNNITLSGSTNGGSMTITVSAPNLGAGAMSAGVSTGGNTAGATGITGTQLVLVGTGPISLSQTTGANGGTVSINAPATSSLSATGQVSISVNGSTISIGVPEKVTRTGYAKDMFDREWLAGQVGQNQLFLQPLDLIDAVQFNRVLWPNNFSNASNSSNSATLTLNVGIYTRNVSTLSLLTSVSSSYAVTASGTVGSYSIFGGARYHPLGLTTTLSEGAYWLGFLSRTTTGGGAGQSWSNFVASNINTALSGFWSSAANATNQFLLGLGSFNTTTTALPASVGFTAINGSAAVNLRPVIYVLDSGSV